MSSLEGVNFGTVFRALKNILRAPERAGGLGTRVWAPRPFVWGPETGPKVSRTFAGRCTTPNNKKPLEITTYLSPGDPYREKRMRHLKQNLFRARSAPIVGTYVRTISLISLTLVNLLAERPISGIVFHVGTRRLTH